MLAQQEEQIVNHCEAFPGDRIETACVEKHLIVSWVCSVPRFNVCSMLEWASWDLMQQTAELQQNLLTFFLSTLMEMQPSNGT